MGQCRYHTETKGLLRTACRHECIETYHSRQLSMRLRAFTSHKVAGRLTLSLDCSRSKTDAMVALVPDILSKILYPMRGGSAQGKELVGPYPIVV